MKLFSILGLIIAITPFLGIPESWKTVIFFVIGLTIFSKAFWIYKSDKNRNKEVDSFKQNDLNILPPAPIKEEKNSEVENEEDFLEDETKEFDVIEEEDDSFEEVEENIENGDK